MTTTAVPDDIREQIFEEAGDSANAAVTQALTRWESGDHIGALRVMYEDGADREWLASFAVKLGSSRVVAEMAIEAVTR